MSYAGPISANLLQTLKGWFQLTSLDKSAPFDPVQLGALGGNIPPAGRVAVLNASGQFRLATRGTGGTVSGFEMPHYLWQGPFDLDVAQTGMFGTTMLWRNIVPAGLLTGLVATGGYELQTTEFRVGTGAYPPPIPINGPLTAVTHGDGPEHWGKLVGISPGYGPMNATWVCGVASVHAQQRWDQQGAAMPSSPIGTNVHGQSTLTFWTFFFPQHS